MVGIVVVSHSEAIAEGIVELARQMGGEDLALEPAGGLDEPGVLGTDPQRIQGAIERAMSEDGVLVLMDLGSALMSAELAIELLSDAPGPVLLSEAPLIEGAVAAAVAARGGSTLEEVADEARGALAMKAAQLGVSGPGAEAPDAGLEAPDADSAPPDAEASLPVRNAIGLHARPAARFVEVSRRFDAEVRVAKAPDGKPVRASSLTNVVALGARRGDTLVVSATGPQAREAIDALRALADEGFGDGVASSPVPVDRAAPPIDGAPRAEPVATGATPAAGQTLVGVAASPGFAIGHVHHLRDALGPPPERTGQDPDRERERLADGLAAAREAIEHDREVVAGRAGRAEADIFDAHLALLDDEAMLDPAHQAIGGGSTAERAWYDAAELVAERYRSFDEPLLRERAADVLDVGRRVIRALTGEQSPGADRGGIVVAGELTPADAAALAPGAGAGDRHRARHSHRARRDPRPCPRAAGGCRPGRDRARGAGRHQRAARR